MKRIIALLLVLVMCLSVFAGCNKKPVDSDPTEPAGGSTPEVTPDANLDKALEYLRVYYKDAAEKTAMDFKRIATVRIGTTAYPITWSVDIGDDLITIVDNGDGTVTVDINEENQKQLSEPTAYKLTATIVGTDGREVSYSWDHILPAGVDDEALAIIDAAYELQDGQTLEGTHTLTGVIISIDTMYSEDYKNITVTIAVPGREDKPIQCYRLKGEGAEKLAIGDTITVTGTLKNYKGTIEFDQGCILDAVEPGGQEAPTAPEDPLEILKEAFALAPGRSLPYKATLTGKIIEVNYPYTEQYGDVSVTILTNGYKLYCYRLKGYGADQLNVNDVITVNGQITNYQGTIEFNYPELIGLTNYAPPAAPTDPHQIVDEAYALADGEYLDYTATLTGVITSFKYYYSEQYQSICVYMTVAGRESKPIYCYNLKGAGIKELDVGDTITVKGDIKNYMGTIEFVYPTLVSYVLAPEEISEAEQILKDLYALEPGESLEGTYSLTGVITGIGEAYNPDYDNVTVTIVVEDHTDMPVVCFRLKGEGAAELAVGDTITVTGGLCNYNGTYEFTSGCTFELVSKGEEEGGEGEGSETIAELLTELPVAGDTVVIYNGGNAMGAVSTDGKKMDAIAAEVTEGVLAVTEEMAQLTVAVDENGYYSFLCGEQYLTSGETGNKLFLADEPSDYSLWTIESATEDSWYIKNLNAKYNENVQSMEFYYGFTTYGHKDTEIYQMQLYKVVTDEFVVTGPYELYMEQVTLDKTLYFAGEMAGSYLATTVEKAEATPVFIEENAEGHTHFVFLDAEGEAQFIEIFLNEAGKPRPTISSEPTMYYTFSEELGIYVATLNEQEYYLGTYSTYDTIGASSTYYITGDKADTMGVSQFVCYFAEIDQSEPVVDGPYFLGMYQGAVEKALYFTGEMSGEYLATTTDASAAVQIYTESIDDGMLIYFEKDEQKHYIEIYTNENGKIRPIIVTEPTTCFIFDEDANTYVVDIDGTHYYLGTYSNYETISASKTSYITGDNAANVGVSQFVAVLVEDAADLLPEEEPVVPETLAEQIAEANKLANGEYLPYESTITGTVTGEVMPSSKVEGTFKFTVTDAEGNSVLCYFVPVTGGTPAEGDSVTVIGKLTAYNGSAQFDSTAAAVLEKKAEPEEPDEPEDPEDPEDPEILGVSDPLIMGVYQGNLDKTLFFNGELSGFYLATTENAAEAVEVYLEELADGLRLFFYKDGVKTYVELQASGKYVNTVLVTEPTMAYTYYEEAETLVANVGGEDYYIGAYKEFTTLSASKLSYITGENASSLNVSNFPLQFAETIYSSGPYNLCMYQAKTQKDLYFTGEMANGYLATTENPAEAAQVVLVEHYTGECLLGFVDANGAVKFIEIYLNDAGKPRVRIVDEPETAYVVDEELGILVTVIGEDKYYLGTYNDFTTIGASSTYYITGDNAGSLGVSQYVAYLVIPPEVEEPVEPEIPTDPAEIIDAAYALAEGESLPYDATLTGVITEINTAYSEQYKNITVTIAVEGSEDQPIECFRLKGEGAEALEVGDTITVTGTLMNYGGKIEFNSGCTLDAVEKPVVIPTDPAEIIDAAYALAEGESLPYDATLTGVITEINTAYSEQYKNITVTIAVEGSEDQPIECFRLKGEGAEALEVGDTITVTGTLMNYGGKIEFNSGCVLNEVVVAPEAAPETAPEVAPETAPEAAPETAPEVAPETAPEVAPETAPEVVPETTPEVVPEETPEVVPEETPVTG